MLGPVVRIVIAIFIKITEIICSLLAIPYHWQEPKRCSPITDKLLLYPAHILAEKIRKRELKSETIVKTYIDRIKEVNPILNAVVEDRFASAVIESKRIDEFISTTDLSTEELATKYPLLGLPLTVKGSVGVEGMNHSSGTKTPDGRRATKDAEVVRLCRKAGAVPLLVSNTPELCMNFETFNKVTGTTYNPYDTRRTAGGSSGGEAALLGSAASVIGIGSDLCGSIRLPPNFCGVWGHKPTPEIINNDDHYPSCKNKEIWKQVLHMGPMTRYAVDLPLLFNVIIDKNFASLLQLDKHISVKDINFYYMENDGGSILSHRVERDIIHAMRKLITHINSKCTTKAQELHLPELQYSIELTFIKFFSIDDIDNHFGNNGEGSFYELIRFITCKSNSVFSPILYGILKYFTSRYLQKPTVTRCNEVLFQLKNKLCEILGDNGVLLYPCHPTAAGFHGQSKGKVGDYGYMAIFNCLGLPATSCPLGLNSEGLPIGVQVVAAPNNDRLTIAVAEEIEQTFGGWIPPPFAKKNIT